MPQLTQNIAGLSRTNNKEAILKILESPLKLSSKEMNNLDLAITENSMSNECYSCSKSLTKILRRATIKYLFFNEKHSL